MNNNDLSLLNNILTLGYIRFPYGISASLFCPYEKRHLSQHHVRQQ